MDEGGEMTDQEHVTIQTGSRVYATGILQWRDTENGTAVIKIGNKIISGKEIKKEMGDDDPTT